MFKRITRDVINGLDPQLFLEDALQLDKERLSLIGGRVFDLKQNVSVIGFGKASMEMYRPIKRLLRDNIRRSYLSVPDSTSVDTSIQQDTSCKVVQAAKHNLPDDNTLAITRQIVDHVATLQEGDLCICLISGGGSALICDPVVPLPDLLDTIRLLVSRSATIQQLNTVRTYLCSIKGGGLAAHIAPATVISLIMSDVIGDPLNFIASGPTVPFKVTGEDILKTLANVKVSPGDLPLSVQQLIEAGHVSDVKLQEEPYNVVIASNAIAVRVAEKCVQTAGYFPCVMSNSLCGEAREVARELIDSILLPTDRAYSHIAKDMVQKIRFAMAAPGQQKLCFIWGGETTVTIMGNGLGGRCQELALAALISLGDYPTSSSHPLVTLVAMSTDGQDGPTDASGAIVSSETAHQAALQGLCPRVYLDGNDSYIFFSELNGGDNLLKSGLTGTNLMDIIFVYVEWP